MALTSILGPAPIKLWVIPTTKPDPVIVVLLGDKLAVIWGEPCPEVLAANGCCVTSNSRPFGIPVKELPDTSVQNQTFPANGKLFTDYFAQVLFLTLNQSYNT